MRAVRLLAAWRARLAAGFKGRDPLTSAERTAAAYFFAKTRYVARLWIATAPKRLQEQRAANWRANFRIIQGGRL